MYFILKWYYAQFTEYFAIINDIHPQQLYHNIITIIIKLVDSDMYV